MSETRARDFWTAERTETLRTLVAEGLSFSQIAKAMNAPSRNSVIGKANRLGLKFKTAKKVSIPKLDPPVLLAKVTVMESAHLEFDQVDLEIIEPVEAIEPPRAGLVAFMDLRLLHCRWPVDTSEGRFYCGRATKAVGAPYCRECHAKAYTGTKRFHDPSYRLGQKSEPRLLDVEALS